MPSPPVPHYYPALKTANADFFIELSLCFSTFIRNINYFIKVILIIYHQMASARFYKRNKVTLPSTQDLTPLETKVGTALA